uniref:Uncharacterized protein n=1 Tax=Oryza brachyantha TaxID=4533 RepID=J3MNH5_ORYBR
MLEQNLTHIYALFVNWPAHLEVLILYLLSVAPSVQTSTTKWLSLCHVYSLS